jgi:hypothetical protein
MLPALHSREYETQIDDRKQRHTEVAACSVQLFGAPPAGVKVKGH